MVDDCHKARGSGEPSCETEMARVSVSHTLREDVKDVQKDVWKPTKHLRKPWLTGLAARRLSVRFSLVFSMRSLGIISAVDVDFLAWPDFPFSSFCSEITEPVTLKLLAQPHTPRCLLFGNDLPPLRLRQNRGSGGLPFRLCLGLSLDFCLVQRPPNGF